MVRQAVSKSKKSDSNKRSLIMALRVRGAVWKQLNAALVAVEAQWNDGNRPAEFKDANPQDVKWGFEFVRSVTTRMARSKKSKTPAASKHSAK